MIVFACYSPRAILANSMALVKLSNMGIQFFSTYNQERDQSHMPLIELSTVISAPRERVFDLARSIDAHQDSAQGTHERAVAGVISGLIGLNDEVTWEARHLGMRQKLTVRVTALNRPIHFQDIMIKGAFKRMKHDHEFLEHPSGTLMIDHFEFQSPFGIVGKFVDRLFLTAYLRRFLVARNSVLKRLAESDQWSRFLRSSRK